MRRTKILGLALIAAAALMAFAGPASATTVTTTTGGAADAPTIHLVSEGHVTLENPTSNLECAWTTEGAVANHGSGITATLNLSSFSLTGCTGGWTIEVTLKGALEIHWTSGYNGTLTASGATVTALLHTIFGDIVCRYITNSTHIGTVPGGYPATLHIECSIPFHSGSGFCGEGASRLTGSFVTTGALFIDP
jgi:hypothetical protein